MYRIKNSEQLIFSIQSPEEGRHTHPMTLNLYIAILYVLCMYVALGSGYFFPVAVSRTLCRQVITLTGSLNSTMSPAEHNCRGGVTTDLDLLSYI